MDAATDREKSRLRIKVAEITIEDRVLGRGAFCEVRLATWRGQTIAFKRALRNDATDRDVAEQDLAREARVLAAISPHRHVVRFVGSGYDSSGTFLCLECIPTSFVTRYDQWLEASARIPGEALWRKCTRWSSFSRRWDDLWATRLRAAAQLASALAHLHSGRLVPGAPGTRLMFRDLKPSNLGFRGDDIVLFDLGLAKFLKKSTTKERENFQPTPETGSLRFMAPEVALGLPYDHSCDIYSLALLVWHIAALKQPFHGYAHLSDFQAAVIDGLRPVLPSCWKPSLKTLLAAAWSANPAKRPSAKRAELVLTKLAQTYAAPSQLRAPSS